MHQWMHISEPILAEMIQYEAWQEMNFPNDPHQAAKIFFNYKMKVRYAAAHCRQEGSPTPQGELRTPAPPSERKLDLWQ